MYILLMNVHLDFTGEGSSNKNAIKWEIGDSLRHTMQYKSLI